MSLIDETTVKKMASLSRLRLDDSEIAKFSAELGNILTYVAKIPDTHTASETTNYLTMAKDKVVPSDANVLKNAATLEGSSVKVKAILDRSES